MSKRLRASMRAANKGRNLRPRSSQPHDGPDDEEGASPSEPPHADSPPTSPSADLHARETVREPVKAEERPPALAAAPSKPVIPAKPADSAGVAKVEPAKAAEPVKAAAQPAKSEPAKVEAKKAEPVKAEPAKAEPVKADLKKAEPAKAEPAKVDAAKAGAKKGEPTKVETVKAEPTKADAANVAKTDPKKAAPNTNDEPKKPVVVAKVDDAKRGAKVDEAKKGKVDDRAGKKHDARKSGRADDDELDPSSISAEFFRKDQDSVPPVEEHEDDVDVVPQVVLSPSTLARRARLRRMVAGVVAFAGVVSVLVIGKALATGKHQPPMPVAATEAKRDVPATAEPTPAVSAPPPAAAASTTEPAKPDDKQATDDAKKDDAKVDDAKKDAKPDDAKKDDAKKDDAKVEDAKKDAKPDDAKKDDAKPPASAADAAALKKEVLSLLNRGKNKDAIEKAKEAIVADPSDATTYLYMGSALQDSGKWKEGIEAYCECVRNATKGPINECRAMGGHK